MLVRFRKDIRELKEDMLDLLDKLFKRELMQQLHSENHRKISTL